MALPVYGGTLFGEQTGATAAIVDLATVPVGAWMVAFMAVPSVAPADPPAGWVSLTPSMASGTRYSRVIGKIKAAGDASLSWALQAAGSGSKRIALVWGTGGLPVAQWVVGRGGVRAASNVVEGVTVQAGSDTTSVAPSLTAPASSMVVSFLMEATSATPTTFTLTSGATSRASATETTSYLEQIITATTEPAAGATTPVVATASSVQANNGLGIQVAIPAADDTPAPIGIPVRLGTGALAHLSIVKAGGARVAPTSLQVWRSGFADVDAMLATPGATWAHRGGSTTWPEMSEWAYDKSVRRGYGALEFSAARTSDGWWFGLHDETIDRTSGLTGQPTAKTMTAAQIQAQQITNATVGSPRPYYGMADFLEKYGESHVLIVDPKYGSDNLASFFDTLVSSVDPSRLVVKYYGVGSGAGVIADMARDRGMASWGYFYQADYESGGLATWASKWDLLGMNIAATTGWSATDGVLSYGKPVVGHIAATQAEYDLAIQKGASMVQCSGVAVIKPVSA